MGWVTQYELERANWFSSRRALNFMSSCLGLYCKYSKSLKVFEQEYNTVSVLEWWLCWWNGGQFIVKMLEKRRLIRKLVQSDKTSLCDSDAWYGDRSRCVWTEGCKIFGTWLEVGEERRDKIRMEKKFFQIFVLNIFIKKWNLEGKVEFEM